MVEDLQREGKGIVGLLLEEVELGGKESVLSEAMFEPRATL